MEIQNAIISSVSLEIERDLLTSTVFLNFGSYSQGFGGYALYLPETYRYYRKESIAGYFIYKILEIAGVENWNDLKGKTIRVKRENEKIIEIGHIVKDIWFNPDIDLKEKEEKDE